MCLYSPRPAQLFKHILVPQLRRNVGIRELLNDPTTIFVGIGEHLSDSPCSCLLPNLWPFFWRFVMKCLVLLEKDGCSSFQVLMGKFFLKWSVLIVLLFFISLDVLDLFHCRGCCCSCCCCCWWWWWWWWWWCSCRSFIDATKRIQQLIRTMFWRRVM